MPFIDANQGLADLALEQADQIVVGAGAAGILLACKLAARGKRVVLIESGHFEPDDERQALNEIEQVGKTLGNAGWTRKRILGGTTTAWGGQSAPFQPAEFTRRDWIAHSGWPVGYDDLARHYRAADAFMGISAPLEDEAVLELLNLRPPAFDPAHLRYDFSKWVKTPNLFQQQRQQLEAKVTLLFNAQLLRLDLGEGDRIAAIEVGNFTGGRRTLKVTGDVILSLGGLETSRALLLNDHQRPQGLGGDGGWLGRAFMEHPSVEIGIIETSDPFRLQAALGTRVRHGGHLAARIGTAPEWQARHRLLSAIAVPLWLYKDGDIGPLAHLRRFLKTGSPAQLAKVVGDAGRLVPGLWALATRGLVYKAGAQGRLAVGLEQSPNRDSRVGLSRRVDRFGQRQALLDWRIGRDSWETLVAFAETLSGELSRVGLGRLKLHPHIRLDTPDWQDNLSDVNHHMGGARMSEAAADGVVDRNLRVWGVANLYVCSAAVFPTSYHSNPTLTVLALGDRLAEHLAGQDRTAR